MASRFDKYLRSDKTLQDKAVLEKETTQRNDWQSPVFLFAAALLIVVAILAYAFQDVFDNNAQSGDLNFLYVLFFAVMGAFFCLFAYKNKALALRLLGRSAELEKNHGDHDAGGATFNVYKTDSASAEKLAQTRRKQARMSRKRYNQPHSAFADEKAAQNNEK